MTEMYVIFYISCLPYYHGIFLLAEIRGSPFWHLCRRWRYRALRYNLRYYRWRRDCRLDDLLLSALNWQNIHTRLYWDSFLTEMYMVFLFYCAWISSLSYIIIVLFFFSHWKQGVVELTAYSSLLASWFVVRQIAVPPVGLSAWRSFVFRSSISMIFTPDFTVIHNLWNVHDIFI